MKTAQKLAVAVFTAVLLFIGVNSFAQSTPAGKFNFSIGLDGLAPTGIFHTLTSNVGLGITPQLQYGLSNRVAVTFTTGYYRFFSKTMQYGLNDPYKSNYQDMIPAKFGLKAFILKNIYLGAEVGAGFEINNGVGINTATGGRATKLLAAPGIGFASKNWDVGARYENYSGQGRHYSTLGLRVAYGFGL